MGDLTKLWRPAHDEELRSLFATGMSFREIAAAMNENLGTNFSRNAVLGRAHRLNLVRGFIRVPRLTREESNARRGARRRESNPNLPAYTPRVYRQPDETSISNSRAFTSRLPKTSAAYRKLLPQIPELSKDELRAMLAAAFQNTAAMQGSEA